MFSGKCELKFYKKTNEWKNSTGSVRLNLETGLAYSYREKIAIINKEKDFVLFNDFSFSPTTRNHQKGIYNLLISKLNFNSSKIIRIEASSLNDFDGSIESIEDKITSDLNLDRLQSSKLIKFSSKELNGLKSRLSEDFKASKLNEKRNRLRRNLSDLKYSNEKTYIKALNDFSKISKFPKIGLAIPKNPHTVNFTLFEKLIENKETAGKIEPDYYLREILSDFLVFSIDLDFEESLRRYLKAHSLYKSEGHSIYIAEWKLNRLLNTFSSEEKTRFLTSVLNLETLDFCQCKEIVNQTKTASIFEEIGEMA